MKWVEYERNLKGELFKYYELDAFAVRSLKRCPSKLDEWNGSVVR
jgi:hypothetical protein